MHLHHPADGTPGEDEEVHVDHLKWYRGYEDQVKRDTTGKGLEKLTVCGRDEDLTTRDTDVKGDDRKKEETKEEETGKEKAIET